MSRGPQFTFHTCRRDGEAGGEDKRKRKGDGGRTSTLGARKHVAGESSNRGVYAPFALFDPIKSGGGSMLTHPCYRHVIMFDSEKSSQSGRVIQSQHSPIAFATRYKDVVNSRSSELTPLSLSEADSCLLSNFPPHRLNNPSDFVCLPRGGYMDSIKMPHPIPVPPSGFQALILCGPGASLNTFTTNPEEYPKCLIPVGNRVMLYFPMTYALRAGITGMSQ